MKEQDIDWIVSRLSTHRRAQNVSAAIAEDSRLQAALERMVGAGASRIGVRVSDAQAAGTSACDLAPPLARMIDHTLLKADATEAEIRKLCEEARKFCFASVCVNPSYVPLCAELLQGSGVEVCTVIGFPLGATQTATKAFEAETAVREGATEVDMVINIGMLKSQKYDYLERDIRAVVEAARSTRRGDSGRALVKVILETSLLTDEEKVIACVLSQNAGADFVKTSTGFSTGGATPADVALMHRAVGGQLGVKASGGVRSIEDAELMVSQGASRLGASASVAIVKGLKVEGGY
jgi:deoxyribose-phosphate aldolase